MTERENKVKIQVPKIVGEGTFEGFVETDIEAPKDFPFFIIEDVDFKVKVKDEKVKLVPGCDDKGRVIFNADVKKNITYKAVECVEENDGCDEKKCCEEIGKEVNGPIRHVTVTREFGGFIEICGDIKKGDKVEVLKAFIKGSKEELRCPVEVPKYYPGKPPKAAEYEEKKPTPPPMKHETVTAFKKVHEKMILVVKVKVVRMKHIEVKAEHCDYKPENCNHKKDECED